VSRAAATLEFLHGRKDESGRAFCHGLLVPRNVFVTYAGEVKLTGLGVWSALRETGLIFHSERSSLAPEQREGGEGDARSDVYSLGLVLLEMLTLERPSTPVTVSSLAKAVIVGPAGDPEPIPASVAQILRSALAEDREARYSGMEELRTAVDTLLFSGELSSTTFNLAFFMHTLFRQDIEREAAEVEEARSADYSEFLVATAPAKAGPPAASTAPGTDSAPTADLAPASTLSPEPAAESGSRPTTQPAWVPGPDSPTVPGDGDSAGQLTAPVDSGSSGRLTAPALDGDPRGARTAPLLGELSGGPSSTVLSDSSGRHRRTGADRSSTDGSGRGRVGRRGGGRGATTRTGIGREAAPSASRRGLVLLLAALLAILFGGGIGYVSFLGRPVPSSASPPPTLSPEASAALLRVRQLEARIAELEREKAAGDEEAEGATPEPSASPSAPGGEADAAAAAEQARAREAARAEARRRAQVERERRETELRRLEEEKRTAEALLVREQRATPAGGEAAPALPTVAPPPPTPLVPAPTPVPVEKGSLVEDSDPEVTLPVLLKGARVVYPPAAERAKREGSVVVEALVDENGRVSEVRVVEPASSQMGFEDAVLRMVRSRRYRPATKRGVPVKIRVRVRVDFALGQ